MTRHDCDNQIILIISLQHVHLTWSFISHVNLSFLNFNGPMKKVNGGTDIKQHNKSYFATRRPTL